MTGIEQKAEEKAIERSEAELQMIASVKAGLALFIVAMKNFALYPETNNIRRNSLNRIHEWLNGFLEEHYSLRLTVEKEQFIYMGEVVHQDKPNEPQMVYPLFRDGIQWFEFLEGIDEEELESFINLLSRFRILKEDAEDDLATALWDAEFSCIKHKTAEDFWESDPMIDIAALKAMKDETDDSEVAAFIRAASATVDIVLGALAEDEGEASSSAGLGLEGGDKDGNFLEEHEEDMSEGFAGLLADLEETIAPPADSQNPVALPGMTAVDPNQRVRPMDRPVFVDDFASEGDRRTSMPWAESDDDETATPTDVATAKNALKASSYFDQRDQLYFWRRTPEEQQILQHMITHEELRNSTKDCLDIALIFLGAAKTQFDYRAILDFLGNEAKHAFSCGNIVYIHRFLDKLRSMVLSDRPWLNDLFMALMQRLGAPDILEPLVSGWPKDVVVDEKFLLSLRNFLLILPPSVIHTLIPLFNRIIDKRIERMALETVAAKIGRIQANIAPLIVTLKLSLIKNLLALFKRDDIEAPTTLLLALTRNESPEIREEAAKILLADNPENVKNLFHLIPDSHSPINRLVCSYLSKRRNPLHEKILYDYLSQWYEEKTPLDKEHMLNCYWAFGKCASPWSITFLQDILMKKGLKSFLGFDDQYHRLGAAMALMLMPEEWGTREILATAESSRFRNIRMAKQRADEELGSLGWRKNE